MCIFIIVKHDVPHTCREVFKQRIDQNKKNQQKRAKIEKTWRSQKINANTDQNKKNKQKPTRIKLKIKKKKWENFQLRFSLIYAESISMHMAFFLSRIVFPFNNNNNNIVWRKFFGIVYPVTYHDPFQCMSHKLHKIRSQCCNMCENMCTSQLSYPGARSRVFEIDLVLTLKPHVYIFLYSKKNLI